MREIENAKLNELISILTRIHIRDDTADANKTIIELIKHWGCSREVVNTHLTELVKTNVIRWDKRFNYIFLTDSYIKKISIGKVGSPIFSIL